MNTVVDTTDNNTVHSEPITVAIVDDHRLYAEGIASVIRAEPDMVICAIEYTLASAYTIMRTTMPHVLLLDIDLPDGKSIDCIDELLALSPQTGIVLVSMYAPANYIHKALQTTIRGYLTKNAGRDELVHAIRSAHQQLITFSPHVMTEMTKFMTMPSSTHIVHQNDAQIGAVDMARLTPREREILREVQQGKSDEDIGTRLHISPRTVETHRRNIMEKLGVSSRSALVQSGQFRH
jgi:DNA-binding NarL/FixJ family response regulator